MQYKCSVCGYIYDDAKEKIPFSELPDSWVCPLCSAPKSAFFQVSTEEKKPETVRPKAVIDEDMQKLSAGQLSALFSNLARGCEKQYKPEKAVMFKEIADYFMMSAPDENNVSVDSLAELLKADISEYYPLSNATAEDNNDRGAKRICVWGEKVTRMMSALLEKYKVEGEAMLKDVDIWVCTVCGFIYIGEKAPELCPVCKVPAWKFEKIEGRS